MGTKGIPSFEKITIALLPSAAAGGGGANNNAVFDHFQMAEKNCGCTLFQLIHLLYRGALPITPSHTLRVPIFKINIVFRVGPFPSIFIYFAMGGENKLINY